MKKLIKIAIIAALIIAVANSPKLWADRTEKVGTKAAEVAEGWGAFLAELTR